MSHGSPCDISYVSCVLPPTTPIHTGAFPIPLPRTLLYTMPSVNHIEASDGSVRHFEPVVSNGIHDTHRRPVVIAGCSGGMLGLCRLS
jgi:hypothetical protein